MEILNSSVGIHNYSPNPPDDCATCPLMYEQLSERTLRFFLWAGVLRQVRDPTEGFSIFFTIWYFALRIFLCLGVVFSIIRIYYHHNFAFPEKVVGLQVMALVPYIYRIQIRLSSPCKPSDIVYFDKHVTYCQRFLVLSLMASLPYPISILVTWSSDKFSERNMYYFLIVAQIALCFVLSACLLVSKADLGICLHEVSSLRFDHTCRRLTVDRFTEVRVAIEDRVRGSLWSNNTLIITNLLNVVAGIFAIYGLLGTAAHSRATHIFFVFLFSKEVVYLGLVAYDALLINHSADALIFELAEMLAQSPRTCAPINDQGKDVMTHPYLAAVVEAVKSKEPNTERDVESSRESKHDTPRTQEGNVCTDDDVDANACGESLSKRNVYAHALRICVAAGTRPIGFPLLFYRVRPLDMLLYSVSIVGSVVGGLVRNWII